MRLVIVVFSCIIITLRSASTELTIELVDASSGNYSLTPARQAGQYDVSAGASVTVACAAEPTSTVLRYANLKLAEFLRFDDGERIAETSADNWTLHDLQSYDTGSIDCVNVTDKTVIHTLYIYVYDESSPLYVPLKRPPSNAALYILYHKWSYLPCIPTSSLTEFWLEKIGQDRVTSTIDSTRGINITSASVENDRYVCKYKRGDRRDEFSFTLTFLDIDLLPDPWIVLPGGRRHFVAGETLRMLCRVNYEEAEEFCWSYAAGNCTTGVCQGRVAVSSPKPDYVNKVVTSRVTFQHLEPGDSGDFICSYKVFDDDEFREKANVSIKVHAEPFVRGSREKSTWTGSEGDKRITMTTQLTALPRPQVIWTLNSKPLDLNNTDKYTLSLKPTEELTYIVNFSIESLKEQDDGIYELIAVTNGKRLFSSSFQLNIRLEPRLTFGYIYRHTHKYVTKQRQTLHVKQNRTLALECDITRGRPRPHLIWQWQRCNYSNSCDAQDASWVSLPRSLTEPSEEVDNHAYVSRSTPKFQRLTVTAETSGWYRCVTRNSVGSAEQMLRVDVTLLPESSKGVGFTSSTMKKAADLVEAENLLMECYVAKFECQASEVEVVGTVGNLSVVYRRGSAQTEFTQGNNEHMLTVLLANISKSMDSDVYNCRCAVGKQAVSLTLSVKEYIAPSWEVTVPENQLISFGDSKTFLCVPKGRPRPEVSWYKDGAALQPSNTFLLSEDKYNLTILKAVKEDAGHYKCVGTTAKESIYSSFTLTLKENMKISARYIVISVVGSVLLVALSGVIAAVVVRKYCRKRYMPHELLLPSKETLNPNIPIDEQTDALRYDASWEFPMANLKLGMLLGQGEFGRVLKAEAMNIEEGVASTIVAVKTVRDQNDLTQIKSLISELKILIHIGQHLNIVNLLGACTKDISKGHLLLIVEYCRHGNLRTYLLQYQGDLLMAPDSSRKLVGGSVSSPSSAFEDEYLNKEVLHPHRQDKPVTVRDIMCWCYQISRGMEYLASIDYIHRDLAARNVLLADDNIVKICDFGLSKDIYKYKEYQKDNEGPMPIKWMAIECLTHKVFNVKTDVWAYGVTMWELFSLAATPYPGWTIDDTYVNKLMEGCRMDRPKLCSRQIYETIMLCCWNSEPGERPEFSRISSLLEEMLDAAVLERLHLRELHYLNGRSRSSSLRSKHKDEVFTEQEYLTPTPQPESRRTRAKYYNVPEFEMKKLQINSEDLEIPNELAPPIPMDQSTGGVACCSTSSSDGGSSRNTRPPSYTFVMDNQDLSSNNQDLSSNTFQLDLPYLQSIDV